MAYLGSWAIDDWLTFYSNTHQADTAAATDADAVPPYRIYEDETGAAILTGNMALLDAANTTGFYSERVQLTAANGFEVGKQYAVYISPTVNAIMGTIAHTFQMLAEVNVAQVSGDGTAADNLELDYDGTGYAKANSTVGTATAVTNQVTADVTAISGDAAAANNAESFFDGTGYAGTNNVIPTVTTVGTTTTNTDMVGTDNAALAATALTDATWTDAKAAFLDATVSSRTKPADTQARVTLVDTTTTNTDVRGTDNAALAATALTDATWTDAKAAFIDAAISTRTKPADTQARVTLVDTTTTNTDMAGTDNAALAATALSTATWTGARAGYLDNLNISEDVAGTSEISALNDLSAAQVNAEVVDALATDTYAEPGQEVPTATTSLSDKIGYLYKVFRNKLTQTAATLSIYNDAGAVVDQKATVSDDGTTFTRGEIGTGP